MHVKKQEGIEVLRAVWLFERCTKRELDALQRIATPLDVPAGKVLTAEGEIGREFFVVVSGRAEATRGGVRLATVEPGSFFGEMALLDRRPRQRDRDDARTHHRARHHRRSVQLTGGGHAVG